MWIVIGLLGVIAMYSAWSFFKMKQKAIYLDQAACVEHDRAGIAFQMLYEAHTKHNNLSFDDTIQMIESMRLAQSPLARQAIADQIINNHSEMTNEKRIGFI